MRCPDCPNGEIVPGGRCDACGLSWSDVEAGAARYDAMRREAIAGPRRVELLETCPECRGTGRRPRTDGHLLAPGGRCTGCRGRGRVTRMIVP